MIQTYPNETQLRRLVHAALINARENGHNMDKQPIDVVAADMLECDADIADCSESIQKHHRLGDMQMRLVSNALADLRIGQLPRDLRISLGYLLDMVTPEEWRAYIHAAVAQMGLVGDTFSHLTGSRATAPVGHQLPEGTDWDICLYADDYKAVMGMLGNEGFGVETGGHYADLMARSSFVSMRRKACNVILTNDREFYEKHLRATRVAGVLGIKDREKRLVVFKAILYDLSPGEEHLDVALL